MKLLITCDSNTIFSDDKSNLQCFTEYGMKFANIESYQISDVILYISYIPSKSMYSELRKLIVKSCFVKLNR